MSQRDIPENPHIIDLIHNSDTSGLRKKLLMSDATVPEVNKLLHNSDTSDLGKQPLMSDTTAPEDVT